MSVPSPGSPANNRSAESLYHDAVASGDRQFTTPSPSARQDDSHDDSDYRDTPNRQSSQSGTVWTTPSHRSITASISASLRTSLNDLYGTLYGQDSIRCLLTQGQGGLNVAHVIRHASKPCELTLYEYCLGFEYGTFHVDSRRNLFYLKADWHVQFDANRWILLPSKAVLEDIHDFVQSVISARKEPSTAIPTFHSKWHLESKTKYTFIPLPYIHRDAFSRRTLQHSPTLEPLEQWDSHLYPYQTLPDLECHIAAPFSVINGGPKCAGNDLDGLTLTYCQSSDSRPALKRRLELLCKVWEIFQNAKEDAENWEKATRGKRKREEEDEDIERLTQSSRRTTRSQSRKSQGSPTGDNVKHVSGSLKRKVASSSGKTLTERAVFQLRKRQKTSDSDFHTTVKRWAESVHS